ncbi:MAG: tetratricopeptide repeat protein [Gemmatimonadota bacterium]|nr:tetratricopeptide repeat protein [Gemmatimonadota bacterium]
MIRPIAVAVLLAGVALRLPAQSTPVDSLKLALRSLTGAPRLAALHALATALETKAPQEALDVAAEGRALARQTADRASEAAFLSSTAFSYTQTGDFALALAYADSTLALSRAIGDREREAKAHSTFAIAYTFQGLYSTALEHNLEALRIREELKLVTASLQTLNNIGTLYHHSGQYEKAIDYYRRSLALQGARADTSRLLILTRLNIGFSEYKRGNFSAALAAAEAAMGVARRAGNGTLAYAALIGGLAATDLRDYAKAAQLLRLSLADYAAQDQKHGRVQGLNALGRMYLLTGAYDRAAQTLQESAALSAQIRSRDELKASYELLAQVYERQGNVAESYRYFRLFVATRDSIYNTQESARLADATMRIVTLTKDNEIESLKKEKVIAELQLDREHSFQVALVVILVSLSAVIAILFRYSGKLRQSKTLLETNNAELERLNHELNDRIHEIKTLSGLLPICAWCKNIRDDHGYWQQLEGYIGQRTAAQFSHGICPDCSAKMERELAE